MEETPKEATAVTPHLVGGGNLSANVTGAAGRPRRHGPSPTFLTTGLGALPAWHSSERTGERSTC